MANTATYLSTVAGPGNRFGSSDTAIGGTVTFTGTTSVVGSGTAFLTDIAPHISAGVCLRNPDDSPINFWGKVASVADDTHLTLSGPFPGTTGSGVIAHRGMPAIGTEGGDCIDDVGAAYPSYAVVTVTGATAYSAGTNANACNRFTDDHSQRNGFYYHPGGDITIDVPITGGLIHQIGLFFFEGPDEIGFAGAMQVSVRDGDSLGTVLDGPRSIADPFAGYGWMNWNCGGHVNFLIHPTSGNACYQAIAFDPAVASGPPKFLPGSLGAPNLSMLRVHSRWSPPSPTSELIHVRQNGGRRQSGLDLALADVRSAQDGGQHRSHRPRRGRHGSLLLAAGR